MSVLQYHFQILTGGAVELACPEKVASKIKPDVSSSTPALQHLLVDGCELLGSIGVAWIFLEYLLIQRHQSVNGNLALLLHATQCFDGF